MLYDGEGYIPVTEEACAPAIFAISALAVADAGTSSLLSYRMSSQLTAKALSSPPEANQKLPSRKIVNKHQVVINIFSI